MGAMKGSVPVFNTPFELGLRMVYLLCALRPRGADLQKLVLLDYAIVYSGDMGGPESLHTPVPLRGGELLSRRTLIEEGLYLMSTRGLVCARLDAEGITYEAGPRALALVGSLASTYCIELSRRCSWAADKFSHASSIELSAQFAEMGHRWGAEFESFALRGD